MSFLHSPDLWAVEGGSARHKVPGGTNAISGGAGCHQDSSHFIQGQDQGFSPRFYSWWLYPSAFYM